MRVAGGSESDREDIRTESEVGVKCFEAGERGHEPRKPGSSRRWKKQGDTSSHRASRRNEDLILKSTP